MDRLDAEIQTKRKELEHLRAKAAVLEVEISILMRAASLRPSSAVSPQIVPPDMGDGTDNPLFPAKRGGKPVGAISMEWRRVLSLLLKDTFDFEKFSFAADVVGITSNNISKRDRLKVFVAQNHVKGNDLVGYEVTQQAEHRFNLANLAEAPTSEPMEAS